LINVIGEATRPLSSGYGLWHEVPGKSFESRLKGFVFPDFGQERLGRRMWKSATKVIRIIVGWGREMFISFF
jgi:hypothetical protein